ncbi:Fic family protein [Magnetospira sp. QH-2]|uniref:Fic family protein n=1 Tax=Magnetospira sp. (strain QH-2) TaxID=1288970 RepID=UPI0003E80A3B|nr:Fic/DOC family N-terminal domain-containing protein [Magnetospira sp. QH-2]CCQ72109.1 conserved protein of unknown function [Magnetospira sp. QH-2]
MDDLDLKDAVEYHYGNFPPRELDYKTLLSVSNSAAAALARYDQYIRSMHNSELLLAPLRSQEAVISSRMEGTVTTLDEVLRYEADQISDEAPLGPASRDDVIETYLYHRAMQQARTGIENGSRISEWLIRSAHQTLLGFGRGADKSPGDYKVEQNYLVDRRKKKVLFVPISPDRLRDGMECLIHFIEDDGNDPLLRTAIAHIEFEALHPFKDGNGRIGRMLIPLMLWQYGLLSAPHFYVSAYLEAQRDDYIDRMRDVSASGSWTEWCLFFFEALENQAKENIQVAEQIGALYEEMKDVFRGTLSSKWGMNALDAIFSRPVFRNNSFTRYSGVPSATAARFTRALVEKDLLITIEPASGRRAALYAFEPLLKIIRR